MLKDEVQEKQAINIPQWVDSSESDNRSVTMPGIARREMPVFLSFVDGGSGVVVGQQRATGFKSISAIRESSHSQHLIHSACFEKITHGTTKTPSPPIRQWSWTGEHPELCKGSAQSLTTTSYFSFFAHHGYKKQSHSDTSQHQPFRIFGSQECCWDEEEGMLCHSLCSLLCTAFFALELNCTSGSRSATTL
jgi:hypothetical protein